MKIQNETTQFINGAIVVGAVALSLWVGVKTTVPLTFTYVAPETAEIVHPYFARAKGLQEPYASLAMFSMLLGYSLPLVGLAFSPTIATLFGLYRCSQRKE